MRHKRPSVITPAPLPEVPPSPVHLRLNDCEDATSEALNLLAVVFDVMESSQSIDGELLSGLCDVVGHVITAVAKASEAAAAACKLMDEAP